MGPGDGQTDSHPVVTTCFLTVLSTVVPSQAFCPIATLEGQRPREPKHCHRGKQTTRDWSSEGVAHSTNPPNRQSASQLEGRLAWRHAQARLHPFVGMLGNRPQIVRREQPVFPCCQFEHRRIIGAFESDGGRQRVIKMGSRTQPPSQDCGGSGPRQPRMTRMTRMTRIE